MSCLPTSIIRNDSRWRHVEYDTYLEGEEKTDNTGHKQDKSDWVEVPQEAQKTLFFERVGLWRQMEGKDDEGGRDCTERKIDIEAPAP